MSDTAVRATGRDAGPLALNEAQLVRILPSAAF